MLIYAFLKSKESNIDKFFNNKENIESFKASFELYKLKYKIFLLLNDEEEQNINLNFEEIVESLKNNKNFKDLIEKSNNIILKEQLLILPTLKLISLPDNFMEFSSKYIDINCIYCNSKHYNYYVCLFCGNRICNNKNCVVKKKKNDKKDYSLIIHSTECAGGNSLFISNENSEIVFLLKRQFIMSGIYLYLNEFGEYVNNEYLNDNYILNKVGLNQNIQKFIDMTYRKKGYKVRLGNN
jgi:hypothetical protein